MITKFLDAPKSLRFDDVLQERRAMLHQEHIAPLSQWVEKLRRQKPEAIIPYIDSLDGGIEAQVLFLLEAPGAKAGKTSFVSRNNPDETAKNIFELCVQAKIPRHLSICWNAVPWYIGSGQKIRAANKTDINEGLPALFELISKLTRLRCIVFFGKKPAKVASSLQERYPNFNYFYSPHPSPMYCNRKPENRQNILNVLQQVSSFLQTDTLNRHLL